MTSHRFGSNGRGRLSRLWRLRLGIAATADPGSLAVYTRKRGSGELPPQSAENEMLARSLSRYSAQKPLSASQRLSRFAYNGHWAASLIGVLLLSVFNMLRLAFYTP